MSKRRGRESDHYIYSMGIFYFFFLFSNITGHSGMNRNVKAHFAYLGDYMLNSIDPFYSLVSFSVKFFYYFPVL